MVRKAFFFLACGAFCKAGNERYIASGIRPSESHQCIRKAGILEKGETRIPARRCEEVLLHSLLQLRTALRAGPILTSRDFTSQHNCSARLRRAHWALRFTARPARRCEVLLHKQTAYGRVVPAFARLSARSGGTYEQSTGLFTSRLLSSHHRRPTFGRRCRR